MGFRSRSLFLIALVCIPAVIVTAQTAMQTPAQTQTTGQPTAQTSAQTQLVYPLTDAELAGPLQPVKFSHKVHSGTLAMDCLYCHSAADKSQHATIPAVSACMGCHQWVKKGTSEGSEQEIAKLAEYFANGISIPWVRVHWLPEHVQFKHQRHVWVGLQCQECHGPVEEMNRIYMTADTRYSPSSAYLPSKKLEMGWCVDCHLNNRIQVAWRDCAACHY
jgi:hypothetical protein